MTRNDPSLIRDLIASLEKRFALKGLGTLSYFLGFQVNYFEFGFILNQEKYVIDLLHKLQFDDLKSAPSLSIVGKHLSAYEGTPLEDPFTYRSMISVLQYLMHVWPDIAYIVN